MAIKLIALDLDGTTLNRSGRLAARTKAALEAAIRRGVHVVIATGRTFSAVPDEVKEIEGIEYILSSNGAEIRNLQQGGVCVYSNYIDAAAVETALAELKNGILCWRCLWTVPHIPTARTMSLQSRAGCPTETRSM